MSTEFRVDRTDTKSVPCGMNSIVYLGNNLNEARYVFAQTEMGRGPWNDERPTYGVVLSQWSYSEGDYVILDSKFPALS